MADTPAATRTKPWHRHFETIGSISAIVVGVAALLVSLDQSRVMREEVRASVWPALEVDRIFQTEEGVLTLGVRVQNAGVGPALVRRVTVFDGEDFIETPEQLAQRLPAYETYTYAGILGRVIAAGDTWTAFQIGYGPDSGIEPEQLIEQVGAAWRIEVCYCSTLGDCWVTDEGSTSPRAIESCEGPAASRF
ncbi:MAG: hypothetical protein R3323_07210 [Wenzhouxiangellaceae bacterium]|nr:hypothetical protein [Wenzhouxiangellaceae bacterium]